MPNDAFIFLFTSGPVAVKFLAVLNSPPDGRDKGAADVYNLAARIVQRIDFAFPTGVSTAKPWWKKLLKV